MVVKENFKPGQRRAESSISGPLDLGWVTHVLRCKDLHRSLTQLPPQMWGCYLLCMEILTGKENIGLAT